MQIHICSLLRHQIVIIHLLNLPGLQNTTVRIICFILENYILFFVASKEALEHNWQFGPLLFKTFPFLFF